MNLTIICVGKLKERYWSEAAAEYSKRLGRYCTLSIDELKEERLPENASPAQEEAVKEAEGQAIWKRILRGKSAGSSPYVVALALEGKALSSPQLSHRLEELALTGKSDVVFVIGGSLGLSPQILGAADLLLSFSAMTFPHQMMRVILLEQIYRAFKISRNEVYHK